MVARMRGTEVYAPPVQFEPTIADAKLSEAGTYVPLVCRRAALGRLEPNADEVQERVIDVPGLQVLPWHLQLDMDERPVAARPGPVHLVRGRERHGTRYCLRSPGRPRSSLAPSARWYGDVHADHAGSQVRADKDVEQPSGRLDPYDHFADNPAGVVAGPGPELAGHGLVAMWHLRQDQAVNGLRAGLITRTANKFGLPRSGTRFCPARRALHRPHARDLLAVDPHFRRIVDGLEADEGSMTGRDGPFAQLTPVPGDPMVIGKSAGLSREPGPWWPLAGCRFASRPRDRHWPGQRKSSN